MLDGYYKEHTFDNGYSASVVSNDWSYGGRSGLFEVGVIHSERLCYATPVTSDVMGYLSFAKVAVALVEIEALPPNNLCSHNHPTREYDS